MDHLWWKWPRLIGRIRRHVSFFSALMWRALVQCSNGFHFGCSTLLFRNAKIFYLFVCNIAVCYNKILHLMNRCVLRSGRNTTTDKTDKRDRKEKNNACTLNLSYTFRVTAYYICIQMHLLKTCRWLQYMRTVMSGRSSWVGAVHAHPLGGSAHGRELHCSAFGASSAISSVQSLDDASSSSGLRSSRRRLGSSLASDRSFLLVVDVSQLVSIR